MADRDPFSLDAKYRQEDGTIFLSGIQGLVRVPIDQHRADRRRGFNTATVISGYPGSPLGGFDLNVQRSATLLAEHNVRLIPGLNEELGGTIVFGGQLASVFPKPKYDGVFLRALGLRRKIAVGRWIDPAFRALVALRGLRGTAFDPFGRAQVRRVERALIGEYRALIEGALTSLDDPGYERAIKLAALPDIVRGYEDVKLASVVRFRQEVRALGL